MRSLVEEMSAFRLPRIESYLSKWASVATGQIVDGDDIDAGIPMAARMMLRPMRPNH